MALFNLFGKKLKGENQYFKSRTADTRADQAPDQKTTESKQPSSPPEPQAGKALYSERLIDKGLLTELHKLMRNHDANAAVTLLSNTIDNTQRRAGIMINKGYLPKRIVAYLQKIALWNIEDAIKLVRSGQSDENGFAPVDERAAASLNLPLGCMLLGIFHHLKKEFAVVLVLKTSLKDRKQFVDKVKQLIKR